MLMTVTNTSASLSLNDLDVYQGAAGGVTVNATGGARKRPLPFPFGHIVLAASGNKQLSVHARDMFKQNVCESHSPAEQWMALVQAGTVTIAIADETTYRDTLDLMITEI